MAVLPAAAHPGGAGGDEGPAVDRRPPGSRSEGRVLDPGGLEDQHRLLHLLSHRCVTFSDFPVSRMELLERGCRVMEVLEVLLMGSLC